MSFVTVYTVLSLQGWSSTMYSEMDAQSSVVAIYFVMIVLTVVFVLLKLFIAVVIQIFLQDSVSLKNSPFLAGK